LTTVSELSTSPGRRRRADARRSAAAILDAAVDLLGRTPDAGMEEVAAAAGVARQTVYAHFPSRQALLDAILTHVTGEVATALGTIDLRTEPAPVALRRWIDAAWDLLERLPILLGPLVGPSGDPGEEVRRHAPITDGLLALVRRGQRAGEFDRRPRPRWLVAVTIAIGHAAAAEVVAGRMTTAEGRSAFATAVLRVYGAEEVGAG
jgi:AcrR family transcriptional regulator